MLPPRAQGPKCCSEFAGVLGEGVGHGAGGARSPPRRLRAAGGRRPRRSDQRERAGAPPRPAPTATLRVGGAARRGGFPPRSGPPRPWRPLPVWERLDPAAARSRRRHPGRVPVSRPDRGRRRRLHRGTATRAPCSQGPRHPRRRRAPVSTGGLSVTGPGDRLWGRNQSAGRDRCAVDLAVLRAPADAVRHCNPRSEGDCAHACPHRRFCGCRPARSRSFEGQP